MVVKTYSRRCHECDEMYKTTAKFSKKCTECTRKSRVITLGNQKIRFSMLKFNRQERAAETFDITGVMQSTSSDAIIKKLLWDEYKKFRDVQLKSGRQE